jgi:subtilase family serine protease
VRHIAPLTALLAASAAQATPTLTTHIPKLVTSHTAPLIGAPAPGEAMELTFSMPLKDAAGLRSLITDLYTRGSPNYRHYLSVPEFTARFSPSQAEYDALTAYAVANHLVPRKPAANRHVLDVTGRVADVERALHVTIGLYRNPADGRVFFAPDREPTPDFASPILHISGLDNATPPFNHLIRGDKTKTVSHTPTGSGPGGQFLGSDMRAAYYGGTALTGAGQSVGLYEYLGYEISDVQLYFSSIGQTFTVPVVGEAVNGAKLGCNGKCDDSEQVLDIEETISMAPGLDQVVVYVGKNETAVLNQMAADDSCKQLSSSWGWIADAATLDPIFMEYAAQGQSFVDATGDDGYHLLADAVWPGDDDYVTGIGGTDITTNGAGGPWQKEIGWADSGGGPSPDGIPIPAYQVPFVTAANAGSTTLRNTPDISANANTDFFSCWDGYCVTGSGGTSYAAPLWAGFIALANQEAGWTARPVVGFLNPTLYTLGASPHYSEIFHDQTKGFNGRYIARPGYDLVTGFGSPNGQAFINALIGVE